MELIMTSLITPCLNWQRKNNNIDRSPAVVPKVKNALAIGLGCGWLYFKFGYGRLGGVTKPLN
ncbi:hypothetical protein O9929_01655 [Vibrio lentus]|nr:hypothetical protein [Vibrio lentus]